MLALWFTTGLLGSTMADEVTPVRGGGWAHYTPKRVEQEPEKPDTVVRDAVRDVLRKRRAKPKQQAVAATAAAEGATVPLTELFAAPKRVKPAPRASEAAASPDIALLPGTKTALGLAPVERTYALETLLLLAA